jgi:hypothetical protein
MMGMLRRPSRFNQWVSNEEVHLLVLVFCWFSYLFSISCVVELLKLLDALILVIFPITIYLAILTPFLRDNLDFNITVSNFTLPTRLLDDSLDCGLLLLLYVVAIYPNFSTHHPSELSLRSDLQPSREAKNGRRPGQLHHENLDFYPPVCPSLFISKAGT